MTAAQQNHRIVDGTAAGQLQAFVDPGPHRDHGRNRPGHGSGDGHVLVDHGAAFRRAGHVDDGLDVVDEAPDVHGNSAWRDLTSGNFVDQAVLVPGGVHILVDKRAKAARGQLVAEIVDQVGVLAFDRDRNLCCSRQLPHQIQTAKKGVGVVPHRRAVFLQQRLAFGPVGDDVLHAGFELLVRRESSPPCTNDTRVAYLLDQLLSIYGHGGKDLVIWADCNACDSSRVA